MARRSHYHCKVLEEVYRECDKSVPYQKREAYIENNLEKKFQYFKSIDESNVQQSPIELIQAELKKLQREI